VKFTRTSTISRPTVRCRASREWRLNRLPPLYAGRDGKHPAAWTERRGVIALVTAPGDGEVTVVTDETMGEKDPLLAKLLAAVDVQ